MAKWHIQTICGAVLVALLCAVAAVQLVHDKYQTSVPYQPHQPLPAPVLRGATLGLSSAMASLLWLGLIQDIGGTGGAALDSAAMRIAAMVALDPQFSYLYAFVTLMAPHNDQEATERAIAIGRQGVAQNLGDWRIPYYVATAYHLALKDSTNAALYMNIAANTPGVPEGIKLSAHNYGLRGDLREETKQIWIAIYENSADEVVRAQALNNVVHIELLALLEQAVEQYHSAVGAYPSTLEDLVRAGVLRELPQDPLGITYDITPEGALVPVLQPHI